MTFTWRSEYDTCLKAEFVIARKFRKRKVPSGCCYLLITCWLPAVSTYELFATIQRWWWSSFGGSRLPLNASHSVATLGKPNIVLCIGKHKNKWLMLKKALSLSLSVSVSLSHPPLSVSLYPTRPCIDSCIAILLAPLCIVYQLVYHDTFAVSTQQEILNIAQPY